MYYIGSHIKQSRVSYSIYNLRMVGQVLVIYDLLDSLLTQIVE